VFGFVLGISATIIPVYINSMAPPSILGRLGVFNQLMGTIGVVVAYFGGTIIDDQNK
jgi:hypothetical protein